MQVGFGALLVAVPLHLAQAASWGYSSDPSSSSSLSGDQLGSHYELYVRSIDGLKARGARDYLFDYGGGRLGDGTYSEVGISKAVPKLQEFFKSSRYKALEPLIRQAAQLHGIDYELLQALIVTESGFNTWAVSPKGAVGLMQLMPGTAKRYGVAIEKGVSIQKRLTDPQVNIKAGSRYFHDLLVMFSGRIDLALAGYNAGENAVVRAGNKIPNYPETQNYVKTVMSLYRSFKASVP